ncbi:MAG TPA: ABC transporter permease [Bryobacteraceae bacterium]|nr:ABC transporter permease [Bryobacteraceae bacterium]
MPLLRIDRIAAIVLRQFFLIRGSLARFLPLIIWVVVDMTLWGFLSRYLNTVASPGFNFVPALLGAVLLWDFFIRVSQGVTMAFLEEVWTRNFLNFFAAPLSIAEYLSGLVFTSIATSAIGLAAMLLLATLAFGLSFGVYGVMVYPFVLVLFLFGISIGVLASALVLRLGPAAEWFVWPIPALISPFAGVFYPLSSLPEWMQFISRLLPPAYVFESMRTILHGGAVPFRTLLTGAAIATGFLLLACATFLRVYRYAVRTGLLARYSAESVT